MFSLSKKIAVIAGGGSGIGKAIAERFALQGAIVCIVDVNESAATNLASSINNEGGSAMALQCNVTDQDSVIKTFEQIVQTFGRVDILVNSVGIANIGKLESTSEADFDKIFQINVKGTYNTMYAAIQYMKKQQKAVILNIASIASIVGLADRFAYSMSKGAISSMTLSVARDYVKEGIRCNSISPARVHTPFVDGFLQENYPGKEKEIFEKLSQLQPIGRMGKPEEVAYLALYLCSDESAFVTGCDYPIDGGFIKLNT
ncbi:MAG: SDR family oxidoreductase [Cyclobacteriaceae bacterium]|nr:SDR family oxidoreductase [Cyclobacteriaceae bacterium]